MKFILVEHWEHRYAGYPNEHWDYAAEHDTLKEAIDEAYATLGELDENNQTVCDELLSLVIYQASGELSIEDIKTAGKAMLDSDEQDKLKEELPMVIKKSMAPKPCSLTGE